MLQNKFEMPLDLEIKSSRVLLNLFYLYTTLVFLSLIFLSGLPGYYNLVIGAPSFLMFKNIYRGCKYPEITCIQVDKNDQLSILLNNNEKLDVSLSGECIVTSFLIFLTLKTPLNKKYRLTLTRDSLSNDEFRRLRVKLRYLNQDNNRDKLF